MRNGAESAARGDRAPWGEETEGGSGSGFERLRETDDEENLYLLIDESTPVPEHLRPREEDEEAEDAGPPPLLDPGSSHVDVPPPPPPLESAYDDVLSELTSGDSGVSYEPRPSPFHVEAPPPVPELSAPAGEPWPSGPDAPPEESDPSDEYRSPARILGASNTVNLRRDTDKIRQRISSRSSAALATSRRELFGKAARRVGGVALAAGFAFLSFYVFKQWERSSRASDPALSRQKPPASTASPEGGAPKVVTPPPPSPGEVASSRIARSLDQGLAAARLLPRALEQRPGEAEPARPTDAPEAAQAVRFPLRISANEAVGRNVTVFLMNDEQLEGSFLQVTTEDLVLTRRGGKFRVPLVDIRDIRDDRGVSIWDSQVGRAAASPDEGRRRRGATEPFVATPEPEPEPAAARREPAEPQLSPSRPLVLGERYESAEVGLEMRYPRGWSLVEDAPLVVFRDPSPDPAHGIVLNACLLPAPEPAFTSLSDGIASYAQSRPGFKLEGQSPVRVAGSRGVRVSGLLDEAGRRYRIDQLLVEGRSARLLVTIIAADTDEPRAADAIVASVARSSAE